MVICFKTESSNGLGQKNQELRNKRGYQGWLDQASLEKRTERPRRKEESAQLIS